MKTQYLKIFFCTIIFLGGCAQHSIKKTPLGSDTPEWYISPHKFCNISEEICGTGEGDSFKESDTKAVENIASFFSQKVESSISISQSNFNNADQKEITEVVDQEISKNTTQVLETVQINKRWSSPNGEFYSMASLDKLKVNKLFKERISELDKKLFYYSKLKNRLYLKKIQALLQERKLLNEQYLALSGKKIPVAVSLEKVESIKSQTAQGHLLRIYFTGHESDVLKQKIKSMFEQLGYRLTTRGDFDYQISINLEVKEQYLNVRGFKKFETLVTLMAKNKMNKRIGSVVVTEVENARNGQSAFNKVRDKLLSKIENRLTELNLN